MLLFTFKTVNRALKNVHLQLHFRVLFLGILHFIAVKVKSVLYLLRLNVIFLQLSALDCQLPSCRVKLFSLLSYFSFIFGLLGFKICDLICSILEPFVEHFYLFVGIVKIFEHSIIASFKVAMR